MGKILYKGNGIDSFTIPQEYICYNYFLVTVYRLKSGMFSGISTHLICNNKKAINMSSNEGYGGYYNSCYDQIYMQDYLITPTSRNTAFTVILDVIALF